MTIYSISNETEWNNFSNDPINADDIINITTDINFVTEPTKKINVASGTFNGQNYTITLPSSTSSFVGLLSLSTGTVKNIRLNVHSSATIASSTGWIVDSSASGLIQRCSSNGNCTTTLSGGIVGEGFTGIVEYCLSTGNMSGLSSGGIVGGNSAFTVRYCYCTGNITGIRAGGIAGILVGNGIITNCISFSTNVNSLTNANTASSLIGYLYANATTTVISNCYALEGGLIGHVNLPPSATTTTTIENSYTLGTYIVQNLSNSGGGAFTLNINDCIYNGGNNPYGALSGNWTVNLNGDTSNSISNIDQLLLTSWNTDIWIVGNSESNKYPSLDNFSNSVNWTGYTSYLTAPSLTNGGGNGDPHIITLIGETYDYDYLGYSRYINTTDQKLVINCLIQNGPKFWKKMNYITNLYIYYKSSYIEIETGFRGKKCSIIKSDIKNDIKIYNTELSFSKRGKNLCFNCCKDMDYCLINYCKNPEYVPYIRNRITIQLDNYATIEVTNVNKFNYNPSEILINFTKQKNNNYYQGMLANVEWNNNSQINDQYDISLLHKDYIFSSLSF